MPTKNTQNRPFLPCIVGPTGAGKSAAALALARQMPLCVVNADSRQVYRDFPLITAQPSQEEQACCPHRLYGFLPTMRKLGAGAYARAATRVLAQDRARGLQPVLVGGTGLYFKALLEGIAPIPDVPEGISQAIRLRVDTEGPQALHHILADMDPAYAAKIHPHDRQRIARALEVHAATGKSLSWWHAQPLPPVAFHVCKVGIGLPLDELEPILKKRIDLMLQAGALDEARKAMAICNKADAPGWSGIGCQEVHAYLTGTVSLDECRHLWLRNTRAYAKRQYTWFKADKSIRWFRPEDTDNAVRHMLEAWGKTPRAQSAMPAQ